MQGCALAAWVCAVRRKWGMGLQGGGGLKKASERQGVCKAACTHFPVPHHTASTHLHPPTHRTHTKAAARPRPHLLDTSPVSQRKASSVSLYSLSTRLLANVERSRQNQSSVALRCGSEKGGREGSQLHECCWGRLLGGLAGRAVCERGDK